MQADSAGEGEGATFTVLLPAGLPATTETVRPESQRGESYVPVSLDGVRVLVVEDEPDTREFLHRLLQTNGAIVIVASSAAEAWAALEMTPIDVLISDIGLPDVDGYDLLQRVRREGPESAKGVPAIAVTAYARTEDRTRALLAGYQAHIAKPVESTGLLATIASFAGLIETRRKGE